MMIIPFLLITISIQVVSTESCFCDSNGCICKKTNFVIEAKPILEEIPELSCLTETCFDLAESCIEKCDCDPTSEICNRACIECLGSNWKDCCNCFGNCPSLEAHFEARLSLPDGSGTQTARAGLLVESRQRAPRTCCQADSCCWGTDTCSICCEHDQVANCDCVDCLDIGTCDCSTCGNCSRCSCTDKA